MAKRYSRWRSQTTGRRCSISERYKMDTSLSFCRYDAIEEKRLVLWQHKPEKGADQIDRNNEQHRQELPHGPQPVEQFIEIQRPQLEVHLDEIATFFYFNYFKSMLFQQM